MQEKVKKYVGYSVGVAAIATAIIFSGVFGEIDLSSYSKRAKLAEVLEVAERESRQEECLDYIIGRMEQGICMGDGSTKKMANCLYRQLELNGCHKVVDFDSLQ